MVELEVTPSRNGQVGVAAPVTITVTPVDDPPVLIGPLDLVLPFGSDTTFFVDVEDIDSPITVQPAVNAPAGAASASVVDGRLAVRWNLTGASFSGTTSLVLIMGAATLSLPVRVLAAQPSCFAIAAQVSAPTTGVHRLRDQGGANATYDAWCDMDVDDGGWTLALKVDGSGTRYTFAGPDWTNTAVHNNDQARSTGCRRSSAPSRRSPSRSSSWASPPLDASGAADFAFVRVPVAAPSLTALFSGPANVAIDGVAASSFLQLNPAYMIDPACRRVFVNFDPGVPEQRLRLGLVGTPTGGCETGGTWVGIGGQDLGAIPTVAGADNIGSGDLPQVVAPLVRSRDLTAAGSFASCAAVAAAGFRETGDFLVDDTRTRCVLP